MCILFIHSNPEPRENGYRLIVASNRDEYYERPAATISRIDGTTIIGGQDLEHGKEGGMWLGVSTKEQETENGKKLCFGAILNLTGDHFSNVTGRGVIVRDYLSSKQDFLQYAEELETNKFSGYNFVAAEISTEGTQIYHHSNKPVVTSIFPGNQVLGFGNSPIFVPYSKVVSGRYKFLEILERDLKEEELVENLISLLKDPTSHLPDLELQRRSPSAHKFLSSIFVKVDPPIYGTRTHSIILVDYDWNVKFMEHSMEEPINGENPKWIINKTISKL